MAKDNWTIDELKITVSAYVEMLQLELKGEEYVKAKFNKKIIKDGVNRTENAILYRMQNISAVFEKIGLPRIEGYAPARNVGERVSNEIIEIIKEIDVINIFFLPTFDVKELDDNVAIISKLDNRTIPDGVKYPDRKKQEVTLYARDPRVKAYVLQRSNGYCELCEKQGPFRDKNGLWFLEVHHILSLALGGEDTIFNTVALCPNCHKEIHYGVDSKNKNDSLNNFLKAINNKN